jgi:DNA-binding beta-propeller fold protein YncE
MFFLYHKLLLLSSSMLIINILVAVVVIPFFITTVSAQVSPTISKRPSPSSGPNGIGFTVKDINLTGFQNPRAMTFNPTTNTVYVSTDRSIVVIDGKTNRLVGEIPVRSSSADSMAVNPTTNTVYANDRQGNATTIIDGKTNRLVYSLILNSQPLGIVVNPTTNMVYVSTHKSILIIDGKTNPNHIVGNIPLGYDTNSMAINPKSKILYAATDLYSNRIVAVIDTKTNHLLGGIPIINQDLAVNPFTNIVYITQGNKVSVIDGKTNLEVKSIQHLNPKTTYITSFALAVNPTTNMVYVVNNDNTTSIIDGRTNLEVKNITIGTSQYSTHIVVNPTTNTAYVLHPVRPNIYPTPYVISVIIPQSKPS